MEPWKIVDSRWIQHMMTKGDDARRSSCAMGCEKRKREFKKSSCTRDFLWGSLSSISNFPLWFLFLYFFRMNIYASFSLAVLVFLPFFSILPLQCPTKFMTTLFFCMNGLSLFWPSTIFSICQLLIILLFPFDVTYSYSTSINCD